MSRLIKEDGTYTELGQEFNNKVSITGKALKELIDKEIEEGSSFEEIYYFVTSWIHYILSTKHIKIGIDYRKAQREKEKVNK